VSLAVAPPAQDRGLAATPEPQLTSGGAPGTEAASAARAVPSSPVVPPSKTRAKHLMDTASLSNPPSQGAASATSRETRQRLPQSVGTTRPARTPREQPREPSQLLANAQPRAPLQPLANAGSAVSLAMTKLSEFVAHHTPGTAERSTPRPQRPAPLFQDATPLEATPSPRGATDTWSSGPASDASEAMPPHLPFWPPTEVPEGSAGLLRSPEPPPQEALRPAPRVPTAAWEMARPVPAQPLQGHTVEIHAGLAHASVLINGRYIGQAPVVVYLPLGAYTMAIDNPGYAQMTWKMHVDPNGVTLHTPRRGGGAWSASYVPRILAY
jgi:hypothetical protein